MPSKMRGSVSARLSVWFSRRSAARERGRARPRAPRARRGRGPRAPARAAHDVQRGALLRARLGQEQRARRRSRRPRGRAAPGDRCARGSRQRSRPAIIRWSTRKSSPSSSSTMRLPRRRTPATRAPVGRSRRRVDRAQQERARDPQALERRAREPPLEALDVDRDVGELGHGISPPARALEGLDVDAAEVDLGPAGLERDPAGRLEHAGGAVDELAVDPCGDLAAFDHQGERVPAAELALVLRASRAARPRAGTRRAPRSPRRDRWRARSRGPWARPGPRRRAPGRHCSRRRRPDSSATRGAG